MQNKSDNLRAQAARDHSNGLRDLMVRLKASDLSKLSEADHALLKRLTPRDRQQLFMRAAKKASPTKTRSVSQSQATLSVWSKTPRAARNLIINASIMTCCIVAWPTYYWADRLYTNTLPISINTYDWPQCSRLNINTDACIYVVQSKLEWQAAVDFTAIPADQLVKNNLHLNCCEPLERGQKLVIWRRIRQLVEMSHD
ncbi:hypothetical protein [Kordiimonas aquimaris]|uniref:hypothetical protein n=1 Tax=Kordiimonas aquimaris TaxID=707591 RepID=UPI0021D31436|nr:hypothetical protein [Kordiimonas aquimaris]